MKVDAENRLLFFLLLNKICYYLQWIVILNNTTFYAFRNKQYLKINKPFYKPIHFVMDTGALSCIWISRPQILCWMKTSMQD
jgi:hypothetical protein